MSSFRFLHLSDLHFRAAYADSGFEALLGRLPDPLENVRRCAELERGSDLDFILLTGDLAHEGSEEDYRALRRFLDELFEGIPLVSLPGNHDCPQAYRQGFLGEDRPTDSVWEIGGLRVVTLDSGNGIAGLLRDSQADWLRGVLSSPAREGTILALHHPLLPNQDGLGTAQVPSAFPEIVAESDVLGIFCGHTHRNLIGVFAGKPYFTADSMSYVMEEQGNVTTLRSQAAYGRVTLSGGTLYTQVRLAAPAAAEAVSFPSDTLSALLSKE